MKVYYTKKEGRRNSNGHTISRGTVYIIQGEELKNIGEYVHQSGGAGIEREILGILEKAGIETGGGYYGKQWRNKIEMMEV